MASILRLPGVSADDAVIEEWVVKSGASVKADDILAMVGTDKAVVDGARMPVGDPIAVLLAPGEDAAAGDALVRELGLDGDAGGQADPTPPPRVEDAEEATPAPAGVSTPAPAGVSTPAPAEEPATPSSRNGEPERRFASPLVRRLAKEHDVDLDELEGTGPGGRIVRRDHEANLETARPEPPSAPAAEATAPSTVGAAAEEVPHTGLRKAIARRLQASVREAPRFFMRATIDAAALVALRTEINEGAERKVSLNDLVVMAVGRALIDVPEMDVVWTEEAVHRAANADVAVAVATDGGLVTPVVRSVDRRSLTELAAQVRELAGRAHEGRLRQHELEGGHVHREQPRHVRRRGVQRDHQPPARRHPRRGSDAPGARRRRRRGAGGRHRPLGDPLGRPPAHRGGRGRAVARVTASPPGHPPQILT